MNNRPAVLDNLFPAAWPAVEPWDSYPWHTDRQGQCDTHKPHSSQALAIDVFGTLKCSPDREIILNSFAQAWGIPISHAWELSLEWLDPENQMHERRRSQIDVVASSPESLVFFECKFTEQDGGSCSQPNGQCNGNYELQRNPRNLRLERCALTAKGIRYWQTVPQVFDLDPTQDHRPCPFAGSWFQWMRNLTICYELARRSRRDAAFVLVYADAPGLPMAQKLSSSEWARFTQSLRPSAIRFHRMSFQQIVQLGTQLGESEEWGKLQRWVERKINSVTGKSQL